MMTHNRNKLTARKKEDPQDCRRRTDGSRVPRCSCPWSIEVFLASFGEISADGGQKLGSDQQIRPKKQELQRR